MPVCTPQQLNFYVYKGTDTELFFPLLNDGAEMDTTGWTVKACINSGYPQPIASFEELPDSTTGLLSRVRLYFSKDLASQYAIGKYFWHLKATDASGWSEVIHKGWVCIKNC